MCIYIFNYCAIHDQVFTNPEYFRQTGRLLLRKNVPCLARMSFSYRLVCVGRLFNPLSPQVRVLKGHGHWVNTLALSSEFVIRTGAFDHHGKTPQEPEVWGAWVCEGVGVLEARYDVREDMDMESIQPTEPNLTAPPSRRDAPGRGAMWVPLPPRGVVLPSPPPPCAGQHHSGPIMPSPPPMSSPSGCPFP